MLISTNTSYEIPTAAGRDYQASGLGTWNGATVTLETYVDGAWRAVPDGAWTANFEVVRTNGAGSAARLVVSAAGGATALSLTLTEISS